MSKRTAPVALSDSYRYKFVEEAESKLQPFPRWCIQDPVMDIGVVTEIKQSWTKIKTGDCQGYRKYCHLIAQGKSMGLVSMSTPDSQIHDHSVVKKEDRNLSASDRWERRMSHLDSALNDTAPSDSNKTADLRTEKEKVCLESSGHSGSSEEKADQSKVLLDKKEEPKRFKVGSGSFKKERLAPKHKRVKSLPPSPSLKYTDSPPHKHVEKKSDDEETEVYHLDQKTPTQFFYDNFYSHLFTLAPRYKLMFGDDAQKQGKMLAQILSFIVLKVNELAEPHFTTPAQTLASSHNHRKVKAEDYDILGQALLRALKATLGEDYTNKTKAAWITVYSALMIRILPFVDQDKRVYIKKTDLTARIFGRKVLGRQPAPYSLASKLCCGCVIL